MELFVIARNAKYTPSTANASASDLQSGLLSTLSLLDLRPDGTWVNPVHTDQAITIIEGLKLVAGCTGILMCIILSVLASTSLSYMRLGFFNIFWYVHQVSALLFFILLAIHGVQGVIRHQTNLDENNPQQCYLVYSDWSSAPGKSCDVPQFDGTMPHSWMWIIVPVLVYVAERLVRLVRGHRQYEIVKFVKHPSNVLELQIDNLRMNYTAGQYIYLNSRQLSLFEWHPFTVTSSPHDTYISVHIRCCGDWTCALERELTASRLKSISMDGPYGSCAEDVFKYETVVLVGAGIGVTPYASILKHITHILGLSEFATTLRKVYFFWVCPSIDTFEWFGLMLRGLEEKMRECGRDDCIEYKIYLTRGWSLKEAKKIAVNHEEDYDLFTGLEQKTNYGRPNFDAFFKDLSSQPFAAASSSSEQSRPQPTKCGVFFCGPASLSRELHVLCNKYSNKSIRFFYNKESF